MENETQGKPKQTSTMFAEEPKYDPATRTLTVTFLKGGTYTYPNFGEGDADEFITAESWGRWFHQHKQLFANGSKQVSRAEEVPALS